MVVWRGSSQSWVFSLPLIPGDLCSLTSTKALWIQSLTTILLLHYRETNRRINTEIITIFSFSDSVLSSSSRLPQPLQLHLSHSKWTLALGPFPISVASKLFTSWQHLQELLLKGKGFSPTYFTGENFCRGIKSLAEDHKGNEE